MYAIKYALALLFLLVIGLSNSLKAQIYGVDFLLEYEPDSCAYIASIIVVDGDANTPPDRAQLFSSYTIVTPGTSVVQMEGSYAPYENNIIPFSSTIPLDWGVTNSAIMPPASPGESFFNITPDIDVACFHNPLVVGDTVKLFGFNVVPMPECGENVRLFINGTDPNSSQMPGGQDYSNGFVIGQDNEQAYRNNRPIVKPPFPEIEMNIECDGDVTIVPDPIDSLICANQLPYSYEWTGPNGFYSTDEIPVIPSGTGSGEYCAMITDNLGCDTMICKILTINEPETVTETLCNTDPYTLTYSVGGEGNWEFDPSSNMTGATIGTTTNGSAEVTFTSGATGEFSFVFSGGEGCGATATLSLSQSTSAPTVTNDGPKCLNEITTLTADEVAGATYEWSDGSSVIGNDRELMVSTAGTYTLTMTVGDCPASVDVVIDYNELPSIPNLSVNSPVCEGDEINFMTDAITDASYTWTQTSGTNANVFNTQNPTISSASAGDAGSYELVISVDGCDSEASTVSVVVDGTPAIPEINSINDLCDGDELVLSTNATADTYTWTHVSSNTTYSGDLVTIDPVSTGESGDYTLVIESGNCASEPATISVNVNEKPQTPTVDVTSPVCVGEMIEFKSSVVTGANDADYAWTGPNNFNEQNPTITAASSADAGTYTLIVTVNGCESDPVMVDVIVNDKAPEPTASITSPVCTGESVVFSTDEVTGATYTWTQVSNTVSDIITTVPNHEVTDITTDYSGDWELTVSLNGCETDPAMANLMINDTPNTPSPTSNTNVCEGEIIELYANTTADFYEWTYKGTVVSNEENPTFTASSSTAGTYSLTVATDGCSSEEGTTIVVVNSIPATPVANNDGPYCTGEDINLSTDAVNNATYLWTGPSGIEFTEQNPIITGSSAIAGTYTLVVTVDGCSSEEGSTIVIVNNSPVVPNINSNGPLCSGDDLNLTTDEVPGATYAWAGPNSFSSSDQNPTITNISASGDGIYTLIITVDGCQSGEANLNVDIYQSPATPTIDPIDPVCDGESVTLLANSSDGATVFNWDGPNGIGTGNTYTIDPVNATTAGVVTVTTSANGCDSEETTIEVELATPPTATIGSFGPFCVDGLPVQLTTVSGDDYTGIGVSSNTFDPGIAGAGNHEITLTVTDDNGCTGTAITTIIVNDLPIVDAGTYSSVCVDAGMVQLAGSPAGGTWSGIGVTGTMFDPSVQSGVITLIYEVTDANGCSNSATTMITVNDIQTVDAGTYSDLCKNDTPVQLTGTPQGGIFMVNGNVETEINPANYTGNIDIEYTVTDNNGCSNTATTNITVNDIPTVDAGTYSAVCVNAGMVQLTGSPAGGTWMGPGVTGDMFDPSGQLGDITLTYEVTDANGCSNTATTNITVNDLPIVDAGTYSSVCVDAGMVQLAGSPIGGTWSGIGVTGDMFDPSGQSGDITLIYEVTDANGCSNTATTNITVNDLPTVDAGTYSNICDNDTPITLNGSPTGGTWSGSGVTGTSFNPSGLSGDYTLTYEFTDLNGCTNSETTSITVTVLPSVSSGNYGPICTDAAAINLNGTPAGGTWSGSGVTGNMFDPNGLSIGFHDLTYTYAENGCEKSELTTIEIIDLPTVFGGVDESICIDGGSISLSGSPSGGVYSGDGITGNIFNPTIAGVGSHTITYTVSENGCSNSSIFVITVNDLPTVSIGTIAAVCEYDAPFSIEGNPLGGIFIGPGISTGNTFTPADAGVGTHDLSYEYMDGNNCKNTATVSITVNAKPIVNAGTYADICVNGGIVTLNGSPSGGTYSISGSTITEFDPTVYGVGTYTISYTYEDVNQCADIDESTITVLEIPSTPAPTSNSPICEGETISLEVANVENAQYEWIGPNEFTSNIKNPTIANADPSHSGMYEVRVTKDGCTGEWESVNVVVNPIPGKPIPTNNGPICTGETLNVSVPEVAGAIYDWSGPNGLVSTEREISIPNAGLAQAGSYCLIVTVNGCQSEFACTEVDIKPIPNAPDITTSAPVCIGTDISFGTETVADSYQWYYPDGTPFSTDQYPVLTNSDLTHNGDFSLVATIDGCDTEPATVTVVVNEYPVVQAGPFDPLCEDDNKIILDGIPSGLVFSGPGVDNNNFDPSIAGPGLHEISFTYTNTSNCSATDMIEITVNAAPVLELVSVDCSSDLTMYTVTFNSDATVTSDAGMVQGNQVIDIPVANDLVLTATSIDGCATTINVSHPQCNCEDIPVTVAQSDQEVCVDDTNPALVVSVTGNYVIDWYTTATGGTAFFTGESYVSTENAVGEYIYYTEARKEIDGCTSNIRTPIKLTIKERPNLTNTEFTAELCSGETFAGFELMSSLSGTTYEWSVTATNVTGVTLSGTGNIPSAVLETTEDQGTVIYKVTPYRDGCPGDEVTFTVTVNGLPTITIINSECSDDLETYTITYTSIYNVTASEGTLTTGMITDIPKGTNVTLTVTNTITNCTDDLVITAPQCNCNDVELPVSGGPFANCLGDAAATLSITAGAGLDVEWFESPVGGVSIGGGTTYVSSETTVGTYNYYVESIDPTTSCRSTTRTEVVYTIHDLPSIVIESKECTSDLSMYVITFTSSSNVTSTEGTINGNEITIAEGTNTTLTITDPVTSCETTLAVTAPNCACNDVPAPISGGDKMICEGESIPELSVSLVNNTIEAKWYDGSNTEVNNGTTYTPTQTSAGVYTFYVESYDPTTNCASNTRTQVELTIEEQPTLTIDSKDCSMDLSMYSITFTTNGTVALIGSGTLNGNQVTGIPAGQDIELSISNSNGNCVDVISVNAPVCSCADIAKPTIEDIMICEGTATPTMTATVEPGMTVDWYEGDCTTLLLSGSLDYTPTETAVGEYTYCIVARNPLDGCLSDETTTVSFTVNGTPDLSLVGTNCAMDNNSYSITINASGTLMTDFGTVNGNVIENVDINNNVVIEVTDVEGCTNTLTVTAPVCECDVVKDPVVNGNAICAGETTPTFTATVDTDVTVDWYEADCTTLLLSGSLDYTPTETAPGTYTYCLIARNTIDNCTSNSVNVLLEINSTPSPISNGDKEICLNETVPSLSVADASGIAINWYENENDASPILTNSTTYTPTVVNAGFYTYYAEAVDNSINCASERVPVSLTIHELPSLSIDMKECSADKSTYDITTSGTGTITAATSGTISGDRITGILAGMNVVITVLDNITGCTNTINVTAPNCDCNNVAAPISGGDKEICKGDNIPEISVTADAGNTVNWYDQSSGGVLLVSNSNTIISTKTSPGTYVYYAEAVAADGCVSNTRTEVVLVIHKLPTLQIDKKDCASDLQFYSVEFTTTADVVDVDFGTFNGNVIEGIVSGQDITITIEDPASGCTNTINVMAPDCDCNNVAAPISGGDKEICFGDQNPKLEVTVESGNSAEWQDAQGIVLANGAMYTPSVTDAGTYIFYIIARDDATNCESDDRTEVRFTIFDKPVITNTDKNGEVCTGEQFVGFVFQSDVQNTIYNWTATSSSLSGFASSGTGNVDPVIYTNDFDFASDIIFTVTPDINGCEGDPVEFILTVNPKANAGEDVEKACFKDAIAFLNAEGSGMWLIDDTNPGNAVLSSMTDPAATVTGFDVPGTYTFQWESGGCIDWVSVTVGEDCPCDVSDVNIDTLVPSIFCNTSGDLILTGSEAQPIDGVYLWEMKKDTMDFRAAPGVNNEKNYNASNLPAGEYTFRRKYTISEGTNECSEYSDEVSFMVFSEEVDPGMIMFTPSTVCQGDTLYLEIENYNPEFTYNWSISSGGARTLNTLDSMTNVVVDFPGVITVSVTQSYDACGEALQSQASSVNIEVHPTPQPNLGNDTVYCELDETFFLNPGEFDEYKWHDGSNNSSYEVEEKGIYSVSVVDSLGCTGEDVVNIKSFCCEFSYPNIIKADDPTGRNGIFKVFDLYNCAIESKLYIYDRWGNVMFIGENTTEWDGFFKGRPVEQGVYVFIYKYSAENENNEIFEEQISGDITVIRER